MTNFIEFFLVERSRDQARKTLDRCSSNRNDRSVEIVTFWLLSVSQVQQNGGEPSEWLVAQWQRFKEGSVSIDCDLSRSGRLETRSALVVTVAAFYESP